MFLVTEADATAIRAIFNEEGELSAAIELRRRFSGSLTTRRRAGDRRMEATAGRVSVGDPVQSARPEGEPRQLMSPG